MILRDPKGKNPNVSLNKISRSVKGRIRLHLDLYADDQEGEVERLLNMGASLYPRDYRPDEDFKILVDPDGNHFWWSRFLKMRSSPFSARPILG